METKIATSVNQSKTLIELGLSADTADMYYYKENIFNNALATFNGALLVKGNSKLEDEYTIPAWSLSALMELMPYPSLHNFFNNKWRCDIHYEDGDVRKFGEDADSPLDAAFEMVCYLLKNKMIK